MESVFNYLEYRDFLKDHFESHKAVHSYFSFRYVAAKIGIDASFYAKVISRQKHLGESSIEPLADFLGLEKREREYFITLVHFNRTKSTEAEKELFSKLISLKNSCGKTIETNTYRYFSDWFTVPVRELLTHFDFSDNYADLAKKLIPSISEAEAKRAIKTLTELKLIAPDEYGYLRPCESILTTGDQWKSRGIREFQKQMISRASEALETIAPAQRDISSVTISTSSECLEAIREKLANVRREILEMVAAEPTVDRVYQINLQVFPLSTVEESK